MNSAKPRSVEAKTAALQIALAAARKRTDETVPSSLTQFMAKLALIKWRRRSSETFGIVRDEVHRLTKEIHKFHLDNTNVEAADELPNTNEVLFCFTPIFDIRF